MNVRPPTVDRLGLGFRVPALVISPFAKRGYVDRRLGEFSSPLKLISDNWNLPYLTDRIARTHNFSHVFDFGRKPRPPEPSPLVADCKGTSPFRFYRDVQDWPQALRTEHGWWSN